MLHCASSLCLAGLLTVAAGQAPVQIILDDMDRTIGSEMANAHEGTYWPCREDAYRNQFHHDWANNKGSAHFTFQFMPPQDGCYRIEEHHPGRSWTCSRYLPTNTKLSVDYCRGLSRNFTINQAINGGEWNEVGSLPFYQGHTGRLTLRNSAEDQCGNFQAGHAGACFWVADAFRLTWTGSSCDRDVDSRVALEEQASQVAADTPSSAADLSAPDMSAPREGVLLLEGVLSGGSDSNEVLARLEDNKGVLEATLAAHFGYLSVEVKAMTMSYRRRLSQSQGGNNFGAEIHYVARELQRDPAASDLTAALQQALDPASTFLVLHTAEVTWQALSGATRGHATNTQSTNSQAGLFLRLFLIVAALATVWVVALAYCIYTRKCKQRGKQGTSEETGGTVTTTVSPDDEEAQKSPEHSTPEAKKEAGADLEIASVSTDEPPASVDSGTSSEVQRVSVLINEVPSDEPTVIAVSGPSPATPSNL